MAFICGKCKNKHRHAADGRACYAGQPVPVVGPCNWLVERRYYDFDDLPQTEVVECGAEAVYTAEGFECANGHSHVNAEVLARRGEAYAGDAEEAYVLAYMGTIPLRMDGSGPVPESEMRRPSNFAL